MKGVFFIAGEAGTLKAEITKKAIDLLENAGKKVAYFKPVGNEDNALYSIQKAKRMIVEGQKDVLVENVIENYKQLENQNDIVIVDGTNLITRDIPIEFRLNSIMASELCLPVVLVMREDKGVSESADFVTKILKKHYINVLGTLTKIDNDLEYLLQKAVSAKEDIISAKMFEYKLVEMARSDKQKIVLPEGDCERVLRAAENVAKRQIVDVVLLGNKKDIRDKAESLGISLDKMEVINPQEDERFDDYVNTLVELRKSKGLTKEEATEQMKDGACFGTMMVYKNDAAGMVSGAEHTTAHTIRPALQFVKTKEGVSTVSGVFFMCFNGKLFVFADCAVTPNPTSEQLAEIGVETANTAKMFGIEPKVAFLSYGTGDSGKGPSVDIVREAVRMAKEKAPELLIEGPIQFDAAIDAEVAKTKLPNSPVAGQATVFIFPDLNTGNCCYKAVQRASSGCLAVGPILQGLKKPVNDLSRGCTVPDIINTIALTARFAQKN